MMGSSIRETTTLLEILISPTFFLRLSCNSSLLEWNKRMRSLWETMPMILWEPSPFAFESTTATRWMRWCPAFMQKTLSTVNKSSSASTSNPKSTLEKLMTFCTGESKKALEGKSSSDIGRDFSRHVRNK
eukprot:Lithocolla_globosa_v1_NODE_7230_length_974_cov_22.721436.p2 type:complete len:130 gc:universal NODE_7230_length_974_cov_22.721436:310-699(+)